MADVDDLPRSLALAKTGLSSPEGARARVRARLVEGATAAEAGSVRSAGAARWLGLTRARAWTAGLMGLSFVAGYWLGGERQAPPREEPVAAQLQAASLEPAPALAVPESSGSAAAAEAEPLAQRGDLPAANNPGGASRRKSDAKPALRAPRALDGERSAALPAADSLAREVALLQRVERAIRGGEGGLALALLGEHERDYPASAFHEERSAARVLAACVAQQGSEASERERAEARRYLAGRTHSVYADRIRTLCQIDL